MAILTRLFAVNADVIYINLCRIVGINSLFIDHFDKILIDFLCPDVALSLEE